MPSSRVSEDLSHGVVNRTSFGVIKAQISLMLHVSFENSRISLHSRRHRRFCFIQQINWKFIPKCAPHFGGLWKAVVKSMKTHLRRIVSSIKLTYEELTTVLAQVECCLNSRPLVALPSDDDGIESLTPGHFLIDCPLEAFLDFSNSYVSTSLLHQWHLHLSMTFECVGLANTLPVCRRVTNGTRLTGTSLLMTLCFSVTTKWYPTQWPLACILEVYHGEDKDVRIFGDIQASFSQEHSSVA